MNDLKCLATVQHTGTWFVKDIIEQLSGESFSLLEDVTKQHIVAKPSTEWLHFHIGPNDSSTWPTVDENDRIANRLTFLAQPYAKALATCYKTVIPVRDPVMSLITRQIRHPDFIHTSIVQGFKFLANLRSPNIFWFPIDRSGDVEDRKLLLKQLCDFLEIDKDMEKINKIASEWQPKNHTATSMDSAGLRKHYAENDLNFLFTKMPISMEMLMNTPEIESFMKRLNYDLPWFMNPLNKEILQFDDEDGITTICVRHDHTNREPVKVRNLPEPVHPGSVILPLDEALKLKEEFPDDYLDMENPYGKFTH